MRVFTNKFLKGLNVDMDLAVTPAENYISAHNLTLTGDGKFLALTNIQGTAEIDTLVETFTDGYVLGVFPTKFKIGDVENVDCLLVFTAQEGGDFKILCYDLDNSQLYEIFSQPFTTEFAQANPLVDGVVYPENGVDYVYFTDNFNEIRKLRCEITLPYTANFLSPEQLSLQRRGAIAGVSLHSIPSTGGSLLCGSYQFVVRLYNEDSKTYTKWTIPTSPYNISQVTTNDLGYGSYNAVSSKYIRVQIVVPNDEFDLYTHFQVAVIENTQSVNGLNASLQKMEVPSIISVNEGKTTFLFDYKDNSRIDFVPIEDIVVDLAAIAHVKTLNVKNNKLFAGNITYTNLEYDNGDPIVTGSITRPAVDNTNDVDTSTKRGMFRDEVYRYYVSYFDDKGNYSRPKKLNMSAITGNQTANGDLKTPSKKRASYTLLNGSNQYTNLNLEVTITRHPSWARGFVVLRAERKKRIKFQTPLVPSCLIEGVEVIGLYPTRYVETTGDGNGVGKDVSAATPMNPVGTHIPKNFNFPVRRDYIRTSADVVGISLQKGEVIVKDPAYTTTSNKIFFVYPPDIYESGVTTVPYTFNDGDQFEAVDYAFVRSENQTFTPLPPLIVAPERAHGNFLQTSVSNLFYAGSGSNYYYSNSVDRPDPTLPNKSGKIIGYKKLSNLGEGTNIFSNSLCEFSNLTTGGVNYNSPPTNQASGAILLDVDKVDSAMYGNATYGADQLVSATGEAVPPYLYEVGDENQSNKFSLGKGITTEPASIVDIVNVVTEQTDDRYGDPEAIHNIIYTGSDYVFSTTQRTQLEVDGLVPVTITVAGGDCYVSLHSYKITDNHYGIINVEKLGAGNELAAQTYTYWWEKIFENKWRPAGGFEVICMPVPYRNVSQVLSLVLESEVNGVVLAPRAYPAFNQRYQWESSNEFNLRTPFPYIYNINYSASSNQKAFIPFDPDEDVKTKFKARGIFSDQKIYTTDTQGFDIFRTSNTFDLEETYGGITKLVLSGNELYALQEKAVVYIPVDAKITQTADGSTLSIRSNVTVDIPNYISRQYGCQHIKSVSQIDAAVFFADANNRSILKFEGAQLDLISENGMVGEFDSLLGSSIPEVNLWSLYDNKRRQYWVWSNTGSQKCWMYDDRLKCWVSNFEFTGLQAGTYVDGEIHVLGDSGELTLDRMYSGNYNSLFGVVVTPRVTLSVNPEYEYPKTIDDIIAYSSDMLATCDMVTETDSGENQSVLGMAFASKREGNYRIPTLRDSNGARLRGLRAIATLKWPTTNIKISLSQLASKYRISQRMI
jgi:hypothetical protein